MMNKQLSIMITEDYVSFETAKLLKERGFSNNFCQKWYNIDETEPFPCPVGFKDCLPAPTIQMAMKWLRKNHNLAISTSIMVDGWRSYISQIKLDSEGFVVNIIDGIDNDNISNCNTYEQACETAIKYCLENLI